MNVFGLKVFYLLFGYYLQTALQKELLIKEQFQEPQITQDYYGWSEQNITTCYQQNLLDTFQNLPPHWSALVRLDLMLYGCVDFQKGDIVKIGIDSNPIDKYTKKISDDNPICSSYTTSQIDNTNYKGYAFKHVSIYVDTCYDTCQSCNGPLSIDGVCTCPNQQFAYKYECVQTCPDGFIGNNETKICEQSKCLNQCQNCANQKCTACNNPYKLLNGQCFFECPTYSSQNGDFYVDKITDFNYGGYILKGLYSSNFGDSEIQGQGLALLNNGGAVFSSCSGQRYLGGWNIAGKDSYILFNYQILKPHWSIRIGFKYIMIDQWDSGEFIQVILNGSYILSNITKDAASPSGNNICGYSFPDSIGIYDNRIANTNSQFSLQINTTIDNRNFSLTSFGIREMCQEGCLECNKIGCTKCSKGKFLYQHNCQQNCPTDLGYWANNQTNTCDLCDGNCLTYDGKASSCLKCEIGTYLCNQTCLSTCPDRYIPNESTQICEKCHESCYTCKHPSNFLTKLKKFLPNKKDDENECISCLNTLYLNGSQCLEKCPDKKYVETSKFDKNELFINSLFIILKKMQKNANLAFQLVYHGKLENQCERCIQGYFFIKENLKIMSKKYLCTKNVKIQTRKY
ncbi:hypothetical protein ABPG72_015560 [Tetrahymena utriculariae]